MVVWGNFEIYLWIEINWIICSAASRCISVPFEWYGRPKKWTQKGLVTLFRYIFHVKTKWNIVYKYFFKKIFSRNANILPQKHLTLNIFGHSLTTIGSFWVSLNYPILNFKKTVCPENVWMQHWRADCFCKKNIWKFHC